MAISLMILGSALAACVVWLLVRLVNRPRAVRRAALPSIAAIVVPLGIGAGVIEFQYRWQLEAILIVESHGANVHVRYTGPDWLWRLQADQYIRSDTGRGPNWFREWLPARAAARRFFIVEGVAANRWKDLPGRRPAYNFLSGRQHRAREDEFTDAELAYVATFSQLEWLSLDDRDISDDGLKAIRGLRNVKCLSLTGTHVTSASAQTLAEFEKLEGLSLDRTKFTDAGIAKLLELPQLKDLNVNGTDVSAKALEPFRDRDRMRLSASDQNGRDRFRLSPF
jgi:hypothetical protein